MLSRFPGHQEPRPEELDSSRSLRARLEPYKMLLFILGWAATAAVVLTGVIKLSIHFGI